MADRRKAAHLLGLVDSPTAHLAASRRAEEARLARVFEDYARAWLAGRHDLRPSTIDSYRSALSRHLVPAFGRTPRPCLAATAH